MGWRGCVRGDPGRRNRRERSGHYDDKGEAAGQDIEVSDQIENEDSRERFGNGVHVVLVGTDNHDKITGLGLDNRREVERMVFPKELEAEELRWMEPSLPVRVHTLYSAGD